MIIDWLLKSHEIKNLSKGISGNTVCFCLCEHFKPPFSISGCSCRFRENQSTQCLNGTSLPGEQFKTAGAAAAAAAKSLQSCPTLCDP